VVKGFGPDGRPPRRWATRFLAFVMIEIAPGSASTTSSTHLRQIPEVLDAYATTGPSDSSLPAGGEVERAPPPGRDQDPRGSRGSPGTTTVIALSQQIGYPGHPASWRAGP